MTDWSTAPEWARFKATDIDGSSWWYENEPYPSPDGTWDIPAGRCGFVKERVTNWADSLERRPE